MKNKFFKWFIILMVTLFEVLELFVVYPFIIYDDKVNIIFYCFYISTNDIEFV